MSTKTFGEALAVINTTVPAHLNASDVVPVFDGPQTQGDVGILPTHMSTASMPEIMERVPASGVQLVVGEATGNTHWLHAEGLVLWARRTEDDDYLIIGYLHVPENAVAFIAHTDEHGVNGVGPGDYVLTGKREMAGEIRRVAD